MPEYIVALVLSAIAGGYTLVNRKIDALDNKIDKVELKVAEHYIRKEDIQEQFANLWKVLARLEEKLDAHVGENKLEIQRIKDKYDI